MESKKKQEIINTSKGEFADFLSNDKSGEIINLFDDEGVSYLKHYNDIEGRISYILSWSKYANILFNNQSFLDLFLSTNISKYYATLSVLDDKTCDLIINRCLELKKDVNFISQLICYFNNDYQLKFIDKFDYPNDLIYEIFKRNPMTVGNKILKKYNIDLLSHNISIRKIVDAGKELSFKDMVKRNDNVFANNYIEPFYLSSDLLNKSVAENLWKQLNIYEYRFLINDANFCGDPSILNKYVKMKEEEFITSDNCIEPYKQIVELILNLSKLDSNTEEYYDIFVELNKKMIMISNDYLEIRKLLNKKDYNSAIELINKIIEEKKSDYIIDYHFEENYYNVMYDLRELLDFYYAGNIDIPEDRLYLYQQILNIDSLSAKEKFELHNKLKKYNMMEVFYDDMSFARKKIREVLKDYAFVKDELVKYKDNDLSAEYGVDVYNINDNPFFAIVKSGIRAEDNLPVGHSYSLVGNGCISVFGNVNSSNTYVYDASDLNPEQIVHIFPEDSFTMYRPFSFTDNATKRVEQLMMPDELLYNKKSYNEILILEQGKSQTDIDSRIPKLKRIALYCVDKISAKDVEMAKINDIGIMLIDSKKYNKGVELPPNIYRHLAREHFDNYMKYGGQTEIETHKKNR